MPSTGGWEWVIILIVVLLVFGVGRVSQIGKELGEGIRAFREGIREGQEADTQDEAPGENQAGMADSADSSGAGHEGKQ